MPDQRKESAVAFLEAAIDYFASLGIRVERVMTDNVSCYRSKAFRATCKRFGLRQIFTKPYTPKMAKPSASFRLLYASGLMLELTQLRPTIRRVIELAPSLQLASPAW
jgi:transposase InsO family protein